MLEKETRQMGDEMDTDLSFDIYRCFLDLISASGARIEEATIDECQDNVYRATLTVSGDKYSKKLKMWAGDAMILAYDSGAPVYIIKPLMEAWEEGMDFGAHDHQALDRWLNEVKPSGFSV
jgi:bifunctional DNase/RNase